MRVVAYSGTIIQLHRDQLPDAIRVLLLYHIRIVTTMAVWMYLQGSPNPSGQLQISHKKGFICDVTKDARLGTFSESIIVNDYENL